MDDPKWRDGYALRLHGLRFDLQTPLRHLDAARELARDFQDDAGAESHRITVGTLQRRVDAWRSAMSKLDEPNVVVKISGIGLPGEPWTVAITTYRPRYIAVWGRTMHVCQQLSCR